MCLQVADKGLHNEIRPRMESRINMEMIKYALFQNKSNNVLSIMLSREKLP